MPPGWRLAAVTKGTNPKILTACDQARQHGADENLLNSSRSTRLMTLAPGVETLLRNAVRHLAGSTPFALAVVKSGRLSRSCSCPLHTPDRPNLPDPDATCAVLHAAHRALTGPESYALNARLVLILMNHLGDAKTLSQALTLAQSCPLKPFALCQILRGPGQRPAPPPTTGPGL